MLGQGHGIDRLCILGWDSGVWMLECRTGVETEEGYWIGVIILGWECSGGNAEMRIWGGCQDGDIEVILSGLWMEIWGWR